MTENIFKTGDIATAIYLNAAKALKYLGCEVVSGNRVEFKFFDPENIGEQCEVDFRSGASVPVIAVLETQKYLRRQMTQAQQKSNKNSNTSNTVASIHQGAISNVSTVSSNVEPNFNR